MFSKNRKQYFIDANVQGSLATRVAAYWLVSLYGIFCLLAGTPLLLSFWYNIPHKLSAEAIVYQTWIQFWPAMVASLLFMPLIIRDVIRMSNRFAGPVFRLRRTVHDAINGKEVGEVRLRDRDYWVEFAADINEMTRQLGDLRDEVEQLRQSGLHPDKSESTANQEETELVGV